jgi:enediyne biosynthesis protein E4
VMSGASYYSNNSLVSHFGLGGISTVDALEIRWPSGLVQKWSSLAVNQKVIATEGADELKRIRQP